MIVEDRKLERIRLRHLGIKRGPAETHVVWWYGAVQRNSRDRSLPLVVVWFRRLNPDGSLGPLVPDNVGITELALLQLGTIWNEGLCSRQILLEERVFSVDFSRGRWRFASQARETERTGAGLVPTELYPLPFELRDRSEVLVFDLQGGRELLVPSLEFFSRCYGRSPEVNRVLSTYPWSEAESRLYLPQTQPVPPGCWSVKLPAKVQNDDAVFVAHVKYDDYARRAAKIIYSETEVPFDSPGSLAFPKVKPWFVGPAKLIVQGIPIAGGRFLALRIVGGTEPKGPSILRFRENPGEADESAPEGAPQSGWAGGHIKRPGDIRSLVNITPHDPAGHNGDLAEVRNPVYRVVGARRDVRPQQSPSAKTQPGRSIPHEESERHSSGERQGSGSATGVASIHTEIKLQSQGAARDVWEALLHLHDTIPELIEAVGWYGPQLGSINFTDREPRMVALLPFDEEQQKGLAKSAWEWVYNEDGKPHVRGVLIPFVKTPGRSAYIFEVERRNDRHTAEDGSTYDKEEAFCGLIVSPPPGMKPSDWIPRVLDGIRREKGVMARVTHHCPGNLVDFYRRSSSMKDQIAGHSTVATALAKVGIDVPHPKSKTTRGDPSANGASATG